MDLFLVAMHTTKTSGRRFLVKTDIYQKSYPYNNKAGAGKCVKTSDIYMEVFAVQSENEKNYPDTISMEEYLVRRRKIRETQLEMSKETEETLHSVWMFTQIYI